MPRQRKTLGAEANKAEIELTPLIDAVFLLLIFFNESLQRCNLHRNGKVLSE